MKSNSSLYSQTLEEKLAAVFEIVEPAELRSAIQDSDQPRGSSPSKSFMTAERVVSVLLILGILGSLGGFFAFVPALAAITVAVMLSGLLAMLWIGFHLGERGGTVRE
jgi:hypothetical protein